MLKIRSKLRNAVKTRVYSSHVSILKCSTSECLHANTLMLIDLFSVCTLKREHANSLTYQL